jgi:hypothetical protein
VWEEIREELLKRQKKKGQSMHETKLRMHIYLSSNRAFSWSKEVQDFTS